MGRQLGAVLPVDLIAVVLLGIVAGGDVDSGDTPILPHGKGHLRSGPQGVKEPHRNAVARHDAGGFPRKVVRVVPAVVADGHAPPCGLRPLGQNDFGKGLGGVADDMDVHLMQAHAHGTPQTGGAELQGPEEPALDFLFIAGDGGELVLLRLAEGGAGEPFFIAFTIGHGNDLQ